MTAKAAANKSNSLKSTGPKTAAGKAVVASNGIRHGILSQRLLLAHEVPAEFGDLLDSLKTALKPQGALEDVMVEKIAAAIWRQRRLVAAETASIELARRLERIGHDIEKAADLGYGDFSVSMMDELSEDDREQVKWCLDVREEFKALDEAVLTTNDCKRLQAEAPLMFAQLTSEAVEEGQLPAQFIGTGLQDWAEDLDAWCDREISKLEGRPKVQAAAALVQQQTSAPVSNELLCRYQSALDNELYKAMRALREQQEWRMRFGGAIEQEAA